MLPSAVSALFIFITVLGGIQGGYAGGLSVLTAAGWFDFGLPIIIDEIKRR